MNPQQVLRVHMVTVTPATGSGAYGTVYGDPFTLRCFREGKRRLVTGPNGNQVTSSLTLYTQERPAAEIPPDSLVEWDGGMTSVIGSIDHDTGGFATEVDHTEVVCE